jgi:hypothetical protein
VFSGIRLGWDMVWEMGMGLGVGHIRIGSGWERDMVRFMGFGVWVRSGWDGTGWDDLGMINYI